MSEMQSKLVVPVKRLRGLDLSLHEILEYKTLYNLVGLKRVCCSVRGLWRLLTCREVALLLLIICSILFVVLGLIAMNGFMMPPELAVAIVLSPVLVTYTSWGLIALRAAIARILGSKSAHIHVLASLNTLVSAGLVLFGAAVVSGSFPVDSSGSRFVSNGSFAALTVGFTIVSELIQVFVFKYLVPVESAEWTRITQVKRPAKKPGKFSGFFSKFKFQQDDDAVSIGKTRIALESLISLTAQGNYVEVVCKDQTHFERMPISKAVNRLPLDFGLMLHRSIWVSFQAVEGYAREGDDCWIYLNNGSVISVARGRVKQVAMTMKSMGIERKNRSGRHPRKSAIKQAS